MWLQKPKPESPGDSAVQDKTGSPPLDERIVEGQRINTDGTTDGNVPFITNPPDIQVDIEISVILSISYAYLIKVKFFATL